MVDFAAITQVKESLKASFALNPLLLLPLVFIFFLAAKKVPAFVALMLGAASAIPLGVAIQPDLHMGSLGGLLSGLMSTTATGFVSSTGSAELDSILSRGGMQSMLGTIWLIIGAMYFGGMMESSGLLKVIVRHIMMGAQTGGAIMRRAGFTSLVANVITPDHFLAIAVPAQMYRERFEERGLDNRNLSRVLEDFGTVTSPLVPWNTCGAFVATT